MGRSCQLLTTRGPRRPAAAGAGSSGARWGFTLIEVLVVVAIIALLVAILMPSLAQARWQAKSVACRAHLKDLGNASNIYAEMQRGYYPITVDSASDSYRALHKARLLKNLDILVCPATKNRMRAETLLADTQILVSAAGAPVEISKDMNGDKLPDADIDHNAPRGPEDTTGGASYEYNACYNGNKSEHPLGGQHKQASHFNVPAPQMLLVHDSDDDFNGDFGCENGLFGGNNCPQPWDNHGEKGMNMMFADGHADFAKKLEDHRFTDYTRKTPTVGYNENGSIDKIWMKSQYPWLFRR